MIFAKKKLINILQFTLLFISFPFGFIVNFLGIPFANFLYLTCLGFAVTYFAWRQRFNWYIVFFYIWIIVLIAWGLLYTSGQPFYNIRFLIQDIGTVSAVLVGYVVAKSYSREIVLKAMFTITKYVACLFLLSFIFMIIGITASSGGDVRRFIPSDFWAFYILILLSPFSLYYVLKYDKSQKFWFFIILFVLYAFAFRSATRSVFLMTTIVVILSLFLAGMKKYLLFGLLAIPFLIPALSTTNLGQRASSKDVEDEPRVVEALWIINTFQQTNPATGYGLGSGVLYSGGMSRHKEIYVLFSHVGVLNYLWKGGVVFFLLFFYPIYHSVKSFIFNRNKREMLKFVIASQLLFYGVNAMSGGYEFSNLVVFGLSFGLAGAAGIQSKTLKTAT